MSKEKSDDKSKKLKLTAPRKWSLGKSSKKYVAYYNTWVASREISDKFFKENMETFVTTAYMSKLTKQEDFDLLFDSIKQDIVGGSQSSTEKIWSFVRGKSIVLNGKNNLLTSALIRNLLRLSGLNKTPAQWTEMDLLETNDQNQFWSGFFSELYSKTPIKRVAPINDKTTSYACGVSCLRFELLNLLKKDLSNIGTQYWYTVDFSVSGDPSKKTKKFLHKFLSTYDGAPMLARTLSKLVESYFSAFREQINKRLVYSSFIKDSKSVVSMFNRHKIEKTSSGKGKKNKISTRKVIIKPTKPSRLATIFAVERPSISELCESAWSNLEELMKSFDKTLPLKRDYKSFAKRAKELMSEQWDAKQKVLNASRFRQGALNLKKDLSTSQKILEMRKETSTIEIATVDTFKEFEQLYITLFVKFDIKNDEGLSVPDLDSWKSLKGMKKRYPITYKLVMDYLSCKPVEPTKVVKSVEDTKELLK